MENRALASSAGFSDNHGPPRRDALVLGCVNTHTVISGWLKRARIDFSVVTVTGTRINAYVGFRKGPQSRAFIWSVNVAEIVDWSITE